MQTQIQNIVVVRFSLQVHEWKRRLFHDDSGRDSWFKYRAELYQQTLAASINAQSVKPKRIFLLMDTSDRDLQEKYLPTDGFTPLFMPASDLKEKVALELKRDGLTENVAITRIDSDDIVERFYFEKINRKILALCDEGNNQSLIAACRGYRSNFSEIQSIYYDVAPFITLFRKYYDGESVYSFNHKTLNEHDHIKEVTAEWLQVIHGTNVSNGFMNANAESLAYFLDGKHGSAWLARSPIDADWFHNWAGFKLPSPSLFDSAPLNSTRARIRKFWRGFSGKA